MKNMGNKNSYRFVQILIAALLIMILAQVTAAVNNKPNTPTLLTPTDGAEIINLRPTFTWSSFSDPNVGDVQTEFNIVVWEEPGPDTRGTIIVLDQYYSGSASSVTPSATDYLRGGLVNGKWYHWHVRVKDMYDAWSDFANNTDPPFSYMDFKITTNSIMPPITSPSTSIPTSTPTPTSTPVLSVSPDPLSFDLGTVNAGKPPSQSISISNEGGGTLLWRVSDDKPWIDLHPESGINNDTVTININTSGLSPGRYNGIIIITSNGGTKRGSIYLNIPPPSTTSAISTTAPIPTAPIPVDSFPPKDWAFILAVLSIISGVAIALPSIKDKRTTIIKFLDIFKFVGDPRILLGIIFIILGFFVLSKLFRLI